MCYYLYHQPAFDRGKYSFVKSLVLALNFKTSNFDVVFLFRPLMPPSIFQFFRVQKARKDCKAHKEKKETR